MAVSAEKPQNTDQLYREITVICPKCNGKKKLKIPSKIISQSKQLTTISIPSALVCEHSFQAFVDKNFKVRGYQQVDFEFTKMEIYEGGSAQIEDASSEEKGVDKDLASLPLFQRIIKLLRESIDVELIGGGIFTIEGKVLYSSIPEQALYATIQEFEVRNEKNLSKVKKMFLELENNQKLCSEYMELKGHKFILVLYFSERLKWGMGNLILKNMVQKVESLPTS
jgi:hypothetical protein